ncbi:hypothetical protein LT493_01765 [Streptomyces tricolor]|nr:hypothetical protein [Streptomyces tricolor]
MEIAKGSPSRRSVLTLTLGLAGTGAVAGAVIVTGMLPRGSDGSPAPGPAASSGPAPAPGAPGIGDPLMPLAGNGGYTVRRYTLDFDWRAPRTPFEAGATISATAQALSRFDLDFAGNALHRVTVDGAPAAARRDGDELVVTPARPIPAASASPSASPTPPTPHKDATATTRSRTTAGSPHPTAPWSARSPTEPE